MSECPLWSVLLLSINLLTWQAAGTRGTAAPEQAETSATLQAGAHSLLRVSGETSGRENLVPVQSRGAGRSAGLTACCLCNGNYSFKQG